MRRNNKLNKVQKMKNFLKEIMEFLNCDTLTIVDSSHWYGNYGRVAYLGDDGSVEVDEYENLRTIYKVAHAIWNDSSKYQDNRIAVDNYWRTNTLVLFKNATLLEDEGSLYKLSNGQLFDAYSSYWYDIHESKKIKKMIKGGYKYLSPQEYYSDTAEPEKEVVYAFSEEGYEE